MAISTRCPSLCLDTHSLRNDALVLRLDWLLVFWRRRLDARALGALRQRLRLGDPRPGASEAVWLARGAQRARSAVAPRRRHGGQYPGAMSTWSSAARGARLFARALHEGTEREGPGPRASLGRWSLLLSWLPVVATAVLAAGCCNSPSSVPRRDHRGEAPCAMLRWCTHSCRKKRVGALWGSGWSHEHAKPVDGARWPRLALPEHRARSCVITCGYRGNVAMLIPT